MKKNTQIFAESWRLVLYLLCFISIYHRNTDCLVIMKCKCEDEKSMQHRDIGKEISCETKHIH